MSFPKEACSVSRTTVLAALLGVSASGAEAADWSFDAGLGTTLVYESNRTLDIPSPGPVYGLLGDLSLDLAAAGKTTDLGLTTNISYPAYAGTDPPPSDLQWSTAAELTKRTRLSAYALTASYSQQAASTTEEIEDVGLITTDAVRISRSLTAAYDRELDRLNSLGLSASASATRFNGGDGLVGSDDFGITGTWDHRLSQLSSLNASLSYSLFDPVDADSAQLYTATVGVTSQRTRRISVAGAVGVTLVDPETGDVRAGPNGNLSLNYIGKRTNATLTASYGAQPTSFGEVQTTTALKLNLAHTVNELSSVSLGASFSAFSSPTTSRNLLVLSPSYSRRLSDRVNGSLTYTFTMDDTADGTATGSTILMKVTTDLVNIP